MARRGIVLIGRNEAPRLQHTLLSLRGTSDPVIYVDSGSTDGSPEIAERSRTRVLRLTEGPFSAARGRQAGFDRLAADDDGLEYVQFLDGDCTLSEGWLDDAQQFLDDSPDVAAVAGRLCEEHAASSLLLRVVQVDWDLPFGQTDVIGGNSLMRVAALAAVGGWRADLVAGEELDLSSRLRARGFELHRIERDMCRHDIGITRWSELWRRAIRTGHSYAELAILHPRTGPARWRRRTLGNVGYGLILPLAFVVGVLAYRPLAAFALAIYLLLVGRLAAGRLRRRDPVRVAFAYALATTVCKVAASIGVLKLAVSRITRRDPVLMEYKAAAGGPRRSGSA
jgi:GT2 family glycosyltransferase